MKDKDFLQWVHDRMNHYYKESERSDFMIRLRKIINDDKWVSVDDEMPEEEGMYLCHFSDESIETYDLWCVYGISFKFEDVTVKGKKVHVTHWMPLPDAPN